MIVLLEQDFDSKLLRRATFGVVLHSGSKSPLRQILTPALILLGLKAVATASAVETCRLPSPGRRAALDRGSSSAILILEPSEQPERKRKSECPAQVRPTNFTPGGQPMPSRAQYRCRPNRAMGSSPRGAGASAAIAGR